MLVTGVHDKKLASGQRFSGWNNFCLGRNDSSQHKILREIAGNFPGIVASSSSLSANGSLDSGGDVSIQVLALCRGDTGPSICKRCIGQAFSDAELQCPFSEGALIFGDLCTLEYDQKALWLFPSYLPNALMDFKTDRVHIAIKSSVFVDAINQLSRVVLRTAIKSPRRYSTGKKSVEAGLTIYLLAQCIPSLSTKDYNICLWYLASKFTGLTIGEAAILWCSYRIELRQFFRGKPVLSLPPGDGTVEPPEPKHRKNIRNIC